MSINLSVPVQDDPELSPRITIIGVGGAGGNAVNNMIESRLEGVEFLIANTDAQALSQALSERKIQLGHNITHGLGAGARPDIGRAAAEEAIDDLVAQLQGVHMVFITAGMGGGTGTGAAPVIARLAREHGILTVGVVTKPFQFEGINRMRIAEAGIEEMQQFVDTLIVIPNQNLFRVANEKTTFADAFAMADEVLHSGVRGVTDLMVVPGLINLDFADIRTVMSEMGKAMMGTGEAEAEDRARLAAEAAISNPLLDEVSMKGARGVLINITGGSDMTLFEVDEAANRIGEEVDSDANIIFGSTMDPQMDGRMRVSVVATGIDAEAAAATPRPVLKVYSRTDEEPIGHDPEEAAEVVVTETVLPVADEVQTTPTEAIEEPAPEPEPEQKPEREWKSEWAEPEQVAPRQISEEPPMPPTRPAVTSDDAAFIPPRPADPRRAAVAETSADTTLAEPRAKERRLMPSLFQRMAGGGRAAQNEQIADRVAPPAPPAPRQEPREPVISRVSEPEQPAPTIEQRQPVLEPISRQETAASSDIDDDLLDIPAFLRRQAN